MQCVNTYNYEEDGFIVTIFELIDGGFTMDIKDLHGRLIWGYSGMDSLIEAKSLATKEIKILYTIDDFENLIDYL